MGLEKDPNPNFQRRYDSGETLRCRTNGYDGARAEEATTQ